MYLLFNCLATYISAHSNLMFTASELNFWVLWCLFILTPNFNYRFFPGTLFIIVNNKPILLFSKSVSPF